jgi:hypothetical protein
MPSLQQNYDLAKERYQRAAASSDRAWDAYRSARARLEKKRGVFAAEQAFINASQAVGRAQDKLAEADTLLVSAAFKIADLELCSRARAVIPFKAPALEEKRALSQELAAIARLAA